MIGCADSAGQARGPAGRLLALAERLQSKAAELDRYAVQSNSEDVAKILANTAELSRKLAASVTEQITLAGLRKRSL